MDALWLLSFFIHVACSLLKISALTDSITASQSLRDGETLVSSGGRFELGFFSPGVSKHRYLGIWYKNIPTQTVVWVANRVNPINDSSGSLTFTRSGGLVLANGNNSEVWSTNSTRAPQDPVLQLLDSGFKPKSITSWNAMDWSQGCIRIEPLDCNSKHDFIKLSGLKVPDTANTWVNRSMNIRECREMCLKNCSCMAFTNTNISGRGSGCVQWFGDLIDIRQVPDGQDLYMRVRASSRANRSFVTASVIVFPVAAICGLLLVIYYLCRRKKKANGKMAAKNGEVAVLDAIGHDEELDLPLLSLAIVVHATDNFSENKKLGEGGFGPVYKGLLMDGQSVAVKRLSENSGQGLNEFKNEVKLIAKLQHRNLVKLLGCCIDNDEKILIYEYMPNGSLDLILFDTTRGSQLDWPQRFNIICGVARGLLYLHQDSRLRVIHRDLKASNILLDEELNPKISDFGLARSFGGDQREDNTRRIVGTYGYMAPEYAFHGLFSVKSDVFSFGILVLEIVSGKKNRGLDFGDGHSNLIGYAWKLWTGGRPLDLIKPLLDGRRIELEMIRCIHVGLLCIQQNPEDRPSMSAVVLMLNGDSVLPQPKEPGFLIDLDPSETYYLSNKNHQRSVNDFSITALQGR